MKLITTGSAGTMESNDIMITVEPIDEGALITAVDKGALDCTVRARVSTALMRAADCRDYVWEVRQDV